MDRSNGEVSRPPQDWAGVANKGIAGMTPADKGWILAFVVIFGMFQISNYMISVEREKSEEARSVRLVTYFTQLEDSRAVMEVNRAQEIRRLQEIIKELTQTVVREAERKGRGKAKEKLIEKAVKQ